MAWGHRGSMGQKIDFRQFAFLASEIAKYGLIDPDLENKVWSESGKNAFFLGKSSIDLEGVLGS